MTAVSTAGAVFAGLWLVTRRQDRSNEGSGGTIALDFLITGQGNVRCEAARWQADWDGRHESYTTSRAAAAEMNGGRKPPAGVRRLLLVRHGHYHSQEKESDKKTLTALGQQQAKLVASRLRELDAALPDGERVCVLHHSSLIRAVETAQVVRAAFSENLHVVENPQLVEGKPCVPEPPSRRSWEKDEALLERERERIDAAFATLFFRPAPGEKSTEVVVAHANVIRYFVCRALQLPPEAWLRLSLPHCSITEVTIKEHGLVSLRCLGDAGFLPADLRTFS